MKYYLDTNIIIYALNGKFPAIMSHFQKVPSVSIVVPSIVMAEIEYSARKSYDYRKTIDLYRKFTDYFEIEPFNTRAAECYGIIRAELEKSGTPIDANDMLIAAITLADDGILVTHNTKEFSRISRLHIEDWCQPD